MAIVPVNVGEAIVAFKSNIVCVAVDTGLPASVVLFTLPRPTSPFTNDSPVLTAEASSCYIDPVPESVLPKNLPVEILANLLNAILPASLSFAIDPANCAFVTEI